MKVGSEMMAPRKRRMMLLGARVAAFNAVLMTAVLITVAPVIAFTDVGDFPTRGARWAVGLLMLVLALVAGGIGVAAKKRIERLKER